MHTRINDSHDIELTWTIIHVAKWRDRPGVADTSSVDRPVHSRNSTAHVRTGSRSRWVRRTLPASRHQNWTRPEVTTTATTTTTTTTTTSSFRLTYIIVLSKVRIGLTTVEKNKNLWRLLISERFFTRRISFLLRNHYCRNIAVIKLKKNNIINIRRKHEI